MDIVLGHNEKILLSQGFFEITAGLAASASSGDPAIACRRLYWAGVSPFVPFFHMPLRAVLWQTELKPYDRTEVQYTDLLCISL